MIGYIKKLIKLHQCVIKSERQQLSSRIKTPDTDLHIYEPVEYDRLFQISEEMRDCPISGADICR